MRGTAGQLFAVVVMCAVGLLLMNALSRRRPDPIVLPPPPPAVRRMDLVERRHVAARDLVARRRAQEQPLAVRQLAALTNEFLATGNWGALLGIGDAYARGWFPLFKPDVFVAQECYVCARLCAQPAVAAMASAKLAEAGAELIQSDVARVGRPLPPEFAIVSLRHAKNLIFEQKKKARARPRADPPRPRVLRLAPPVVRPREPVVQREPAVPLIALIPPDAMATGRGLLRPGPNVRAPPTPHADPLERVMQDPQNVHDHGVQSAVCKTVGTLSATYSTNPESAARSVEQLQRALDAHPTLAPADKERALRVLAVMRKQRVPHSRVGLTEGEVLDLVWQRTSAIDDPAVRLNCLETLGKQVASAVENGMVVCSTGRLARAVTALDGIAQEVSTSKPLWAVKDELASLAAKVRADSLEAASEADRQAYEGGTAAALEKQMQDEFRSRAHGTYVEELGMSPTVLEPLVDAMAEAF